MPIEDGEALLMSIGGADDNERKAIAEARRTLLRSVRVHLGEEDVSEELGAEQKFILAETLNGGKHELIKEL